MAYRYSEQGLIWAMRVFFYQKTNYAQAKDGAELERLRLLALQHAKNDMHYLGDVANHPNIANYLAHRRPELKIESIDTTQDLVDAYCSYGPDRAKFFKKNFNAWEYADNGDKDKLLARMKERIVADIDFERSVRKGKVLGSLETDVEEDSANVCTRNPRWLKKMIGSESDAGRKFYVLGLAHLLPRSSGKGPCDDLLTMLRRAGMSVRQIE